MSEQFFVVGWTQLWQVTYVIVVVGLMTRLLCRSRPHLAVVLWLVALAKCIVPPVVFAPFGVFCQYSEPEPVTESAVGPVAMFTADSETGSSASRPVTDSVATHGAENTQVSTPPNLMLRDIVFVVWLIGAALMLLGAAVRLFVCLRRVHKSVVPVPAEFRDIVSTLQERVGVRSRIQLLITSSAIGPAVVGLFRPRIVLPDVIARESADRLLPILAHELVHIRRGDLWVSLLSTISRAVWWFHPLVWWVTREVSREIERACDEEVLGTLDCRPQDYARSLLCVLEHKHTLRAVPAFPGVRPVEVTSQRMERIMNLRQGRRRSHWMPRLLLLTGAALILPGAVASQEPGEATRAESQQTVRIQATLISASGETLDAILPDDTQVSQNSGQRQFGLGIRTIARQLPQADPSVSESLPAVPRVAGSIQLVASEDKDRIVDDLKAHKADVLLAPVLICRSGSTATCSANIATDPAAGQRALDAVRHTSLQVTPIIEAGGTVRLQVRFSPDNQPKAAGKKKAVELSTRLGSQQVLLARLPGNTAAHETLVILQATPQQPPPRLPFAVRQGSTVLVRSMILAREGDSSGEAEDDWNVFVSEPDGLSEARQIPATRDEHAPGDQHCRVVSHAVRLPLVTGPPCMLKQVATLPLADGWELISRPSVCTVSGQTARIEVGATNRTLKLELTPEVTADGLKLQGALESGSQGRMVTHRFAPVTVRTDRATVLGFDEGHRRVLLVMNFQLNPAPMQTARPIPKAGTIERLGFRSSPVQHSLPAGRFAVPAAAPEEGFVTRSYAVADLLIPVPGAPRRDPSELADELCQLVRTTIEPDSWNASAAIVPNEPTLSLVVRQRPQVHAAITELLDSLRKIQDEQIVVDLSVFSGKGAATQQTTVVARSIKLAQPVARGPRVTLFSGRRARLEAECRISDGRVLRIPLDLMAATRPNGAIRLSTSVGSESQVLNVPRGSEVLMEISEELRGIPDLRVPAGQRVWLLLRPRQLPAAAELPFRK